ncbi:hypothetical protein CYD85_28910, partial [Klebsiella pneumoniae]
GTVCVVGKMRDLILQLSKSSIYSTKPSRPYTIVSALALKVTFDAQSVNVRGFRSPHQNTRPDQTYSCSPERPG